MNAFQKILLTNCPGLLTSGQPPVFQSFWITDLDNVQRLYNIDQFFFNINNIQLQSSEQTNYSCNEMFLEVFVEPPMDDDISLDIKSAIVIFDQYYKYELKYIIDEIKVSYDAELILRYQEAISARIMDLIFSRVIKLFNKITLPKFVVPNIRYINQIFSNDLNPFPAHFVNGFNVLNNFLQQFIREQITLKNCMKQ